MIIKLYFCNTIIETATSNKLKIEIMTKVLIQSEATAQAQQAIKFTTRKAAEKYIAKKEGRYMIIFFSHAYYTSI